MTRLLCIAFGFFLAICYVGLRGIVRDEVMFVRKRRT
jgi:hypothetical protein